MEGNSVTKQTENRTFTLVQRTREEKGFYCLMGRFFGSRAIAKANSMPMFDDEGRIWCIILDEAGEPVACSSIEIKGRQAKLKSAWVEPHVRGLKLYDWMFMTRLEIAAQYAITTITATTTERSVHTHERYGFQHVGMRGKYYLFKKELV